MSNERRRPEGFIPELDGYRVLLIFIVSWYHIWQQSWLTPYAGRLSLDFLVRSGYMHVDGTILLSAFLLFLPWARAMDRHEPSPDAVSFYRRRFARVYPSYLFILLAVFFGVALPWGLYTSPQNLAMDLATHLTFTFNFFPFTYQATPLGAACWTLAVEVQAYLLFPAVARGVRRHPAATLGALCLAGWGYRAWCVWALPDYTMVLNQLPAFLDVYALGILLSMAHVRLEKRRSDGAAPLWEQLLATGLAAAGIWLLVLLLKRQAASSSYTMLQEGQLVRRLPLALIYGLLILSLPRMLKPLRLLFGNRLMSWLARLSMNYYLIHQTVAVHLKRIGFPPSQSAVPNQAGERPWQWRYTLLTFGLSLLLAALTTRFVEKPCARWLARRFKLDDDRQAAREWAAHWPGRAGS